MRGYIHITEYNCLYPITMATVTGPGGSLTTESILVIPWIKGGGITAVGVKDEVRYVYVQ